MNMKTHIIYLFILTVGIFGSVACDQGHPLSNTELTAEADTTLVGPTWQLVAFVEADGNHTTPGSVRSEYEGTAYSITFTKQPVDSLGIPHAPGGSYSMKVIGYPNEGFFSYELKSEKERSFAIYFHGATEINQFSGSKESVFFKTLKTVKGYRINGKKLRLFYNDGKALLFELAKSSEGE